MKWACAGSADGFSGLYWHHGFWNNPLRVVLFDAWPSTRAVASRFAQYETLLSEVSCTMLLNVPSSVTSLLFPLPASAVGVIAVILYFYVNLSYILWYPRIFYPCSSNDSPRLTFFLHFHNCFFKELDCGRYVQCYVACITTNDRYTIRTNSFMYTNVHMYM